MNSGEKGGMIGDNNCFCRLESFFMYTIEKNSRAAGFLCSIASQLTYGFAVFFWKALKTIPPYELLTLRILFSFFTSGIVYLAVKKRGDLRAFFQNRRDAVILLIAGFALAVNWGAFIWGVNNGFIIESSLGLYLVPIFTSLGGILLFRETPDRSILTALCLAFSGVLFMTAGYGRFPYVSVLLATSYSLYLVLKKKLNMEPFLGLFLESFVTVPAALVYFGYLFSTEQSGFLQATFPIALLAAFSGVITVLPLLFAMLAQKRIGLTAMGLMAYITPVFHTTVGVFVYGEDFTFYHAGAFLMILLALTVFTKGQIKKAKKHAS